MGLWSTWKTPIILQMESVECGAACLGIILAHYGDYRPLPELRLACGVSRDGVKASGIVRTAKQYHLEAQGYKKEHLNDLKTLTFPLIIFWKFNHFVVLEKIDQDFVYLNDPAVGHRKVSHPEFDDSFTGVVISLKPGPKFEKKNRPPSMAHMIYPWIKSQKKAISLIFMAGFLLVFPAIFIPIIGKLFIDHVLIENQLDWRQGIFLAMGLSIASQIVLLSLQHYYSYRLEQSVSVSKSSQAVWHILNLPISFFSQRQTGEVASRISMAATIAQTVSGQVIQLGVSLLSATLFLALLLAYNVGLAVILLVLALLNLAAIRAVVTSQKEHAFVASREEGLLYGTSMNGLASIETLKALGREADFFQKWAGGHAKLSNAWTKVMASSDRLLSLQTLSIGFIQIVILVLGGLSVIHSGMTLGSLAAFLTLSMGFLKPVFDISAIVNQIHRLQTDMLRLADLHSYPVEPKRPTAFSFGTALPLGHLQLKDLTFGYSSLDPPLIEKFNLDIRPGTRTAIIGGSGSGKSTLGKLISRLYSSWEGEILIDGQPLAHIPDEEWAGIMAMVDQDVVLFQGSIRDNITLWDSSIPESAVIQAAKDAMIHDDISARPLGYDDMVMEGGSNLSGGQRQRLEIARALVRNPRILILDEATSALDPVVELEIDQQLRRRGATIIVISHRLSTIRDADQIVVMDHGKIAAIGSHDQLMETHLPYAQSMRGDG